MEDKLNITRNDIMIPLDDLSNYDIYEYWDKEDVLDIILEHTYTCLTNVRYRHHDWGIGCGEYDICISRKKVYNEFIYKKYND